MDKGVSRAEGMRRARAYAAQAGVLFPSVGGTAKGLRRAIVAFATARGIDARTGEPFHDCDGCGKQAAEVDESLCAACKGKVRR